MNLNWSQVETKDQTLKGQIWAWKTLRVFSQKKNETNLIKDFILFIDTESPSFV